MFCWVNKILSCCN